jgi:hypothetical protein
MLKGFNAGLSFLVFEDVDVGVAAVVVDEYDKVQGFFDRFGGERSTGV